MKIPIRKNAPGASTIRPFGWYQPPSVIERQDLDAEELAGAEQLAEEADDDQDQCCSRGRCRGRRENSRIGGFCIAKASARPMTMQLVMIRPTKTESCFEMSKTKAFRT